MSLYRNICRKKKREYNQKDAQRLVQLSKTDPTAFWKETKTVKKREITPPCNFYDHFKNLANREPGIGDEGRAEIEEGDLVNNETNVEILDNPIDMNELDKAINSLKREKSAGHDSILNEFIIHASLSVKVLILLLFNIILKLEHFPAFWAVGTVVPIFKKGDKNDVNNYRGITLLSCLGKLFTRILNNRLHTWAESQTILSEGQFGFREGRGTADCLFVLHGLIELLLAKGKKLYCVFIDYEKAFDYLDRAALWTKLTKEGVSSKCVRLFRNMYSKITLEVRGDNSNRFFQSRCGVLQGESTSPLLFSLFVNDLERTLTHQSIGIKIHETIMKLLMFADDMTIFSETREGLQTGLNCLESYCTKWGLVVNTAKTKVVVFRKGGRLGQYDNWILGGKTLDIVPSFKYLGLHLGASGSFSKGIQELVISARKALFALKKQFYKNPEILPSLQLMLFKSMISPILSYCCEVWGLCKADPVETFHLQFLKTMLCVKTSTPNCFVYGEVGVFPLSIERKMRVIKYWLKLTRMNESTNCYIKMIYNELLLLSVQDPSVTTWATLVKDMLQRSGFGHYWLQQRVQNEEKFLTMFKQRLQDMYMQDWRGEVSITSDHRLYKHVKDTFSFETYLNLNKFLRNAITKIRLSSHLFLIERGRWGARRITHEERKCTLCNTVEDEFHCLIECPRFSNERRNLLSECLSKRPSMFEFVNFVKSESETVQKRLGLLCFRVQKEHKKYV